MPWRRSRPTPMWLWSLRDSCQEIDELTPLCRAQGSEHRVLDPVENRVKPVQRIGPVGGERDDVPAFVVGVDLPLDEAT